MTPEFYFLSQQRQAELEAARLAKEKEDEEIRQQAMVMKKEKDIQKKAIKKERQKLRTTCKVYGGCCCSDFIHIITPTRRILVQNSIVHWSLSWENFLIPLSCLGIT